MPAWAQATRPQQSAQHPLQTTLPTRSPPSSSASPPCLPSSSAKIWPTTSAPPSASVVLVTSPQGELTPFGMVPKYNRFRVVGIFNSGFFDYDSSWAFARLSDAQQLFGLGDLISVTGIQNRRLYRADAITSRDSKTPPAKASWPPTRSSKTRPCFKRCARAPGHLHHHRPHRLRRRPQHPDLSDHDGHGKDQGHRRAHVDGHASGPGAQPFYRAGRADRRHRHRHRPGASDTPSPTPEAITTSFRFRPRSIRSTTSPSLPG